MHAGPLSRRARRHARPSGDRAALRAVSTHALGTRAIRDAGSMARLVNAPKPPGPRPSPPPSSSPSASASFTAAVVVATTAAAGVAVAGNADAAAWGAALVLGRSVMWPISADRPALATQSSRSSRCRPYGRCRRGWCCCCCRCKAAWLDAWLDGALLSPSAEVEELAASEPSLGPARSRLVTGAPAVSPPCEEAAAPYCMFSAQTRAATTKPRPLPTAAAIATHNGSTTLRR